MNILFISKNTPDLQMLHIILLSIKKTKPSK